MEYIATQYSYLSHMSVALKNASCNHFFAINTVVDWWLYLLNSYAHNS
jgi:hypothetical protein